jgi:predicted DNA-binding antitoxin AbrB/MazE fold protein
MTIVTIPAIYQGGVLRPQVKLNLPDNTPVQIQVTTWPASATVAGSLFGAFPSLATLTSDDLDWAKRLWGHGVEQQSRRLDGLTSA